jgi:hypothetical protein
MYTLLCEHRYHVQIGSQTHILRIEELISGQVGWGGKFRLQIAASLDSEAQTFYGASKHEVAELGARFLDRREKQLSS